MKAQATAWVYLVREISSEYQKLPTSLAHGPSVVLTFIRCLCFRPPGGHAGSHGQLQHHSQRAEAALQYAEGRKRHLGE